MKISQKIIAGPLLIALFIPLLGYFSHSSSQKSIATFQEICGETLPGTVTAVAIEKDLYHILYAASRYVESGDQQYRRHVEDSLASLAKNEALHALYHGYRTDSEHGDFHDYIREYSRLLSSYLLLRDKDSSVAELSDKRAEIEETLSALEAIVHSDQDIQAAAEDFNLSLHDMKDKSRSWRILLAVIIVLALAIAWLTSRQISGPITKLHQGVLEISQGNLEGRMDVSGRDEVAELAAAFNSMLSSLRHANGRLALEIEDKQRALLEAQEGSRLKSEFLDNMSHELRTPMNAIIGFSDFLQSREQDETTQEYLQEIRQAAQALLILINKVLDFSEMSAEETGFSSREFPLTSLLEALNWEFTGQAARKGLSFKMDISPDIPTTLVGPAERLHQLIAILLGNSFKFTPAGEVSLTLSLLSRQEETVVIGLAVQDTGIGIATKDIDTLCTPFRQEDGSHARKFEGIGLGLALARTIVTKMGGDLVFTSELGKGTTFSCELMLKVGGEGRSLQGPGGPI